MPGRFLQRSESGLAILLLFDNVPQIVSVLYIRTCRRNNGRGIVSIELAGNSSHNDSVQTNLTVGSSSCVVTRRTAEHG